MLPYFLKHAAENAKKIKLMRHFGGLATEHIPFIDPDMSDTRKHILFEELLYLKYIKNESFLIPSVIISDSFLPFNLDMKSEFFFQADQAAMVFVPLDNSENNKPPGFIHLWLFSGMPKEFPDHKEFLDGTDIIDSSVKIYISHSHTCENSRISGHSWQLAYRVAEFALSDGAHNRELAEEWIISGICENSKVGRIVCGNKLDLGLRRKKWLFPLANREDIPPKYSDLTIKFTSTVSDAWAHISNTGVKKGGIQQWPDQIDELHILVGGSIKAPFMPLLLTNTGKVVLWTSESKTYSKDPAELLSKIIKRLYPDIDIKWGAELSSHNIQKTENNLLEYFKGKERLKIIFNITSGTRMMGLGAQTVARLSPNVELVYRELSNEESGEFMHLLYTEFPPYSGLLRTTDKIKEEYNWEFLKSNDHNAPFKGADEFIIKIKDI